MEFIEQFKNYLNTQKKQASKATVKNYIADIKKFVKWHEETFKKVFDPSAVTPQMIELFKISRKDVSSTISPRSVERYMSSLRKFFHFLKLEGISFSNPFDLDARRSMLDADPYHLSDFKSHLYVYNAANLTIKNYVIDVRQFLNWAEQVTGAKDAWHVKDKNIFDKIDAFLIEEYKKRLLNRGMSPASINRKLSSLRRYLKWAESDGLIKKPVVILSAPPRSGKYSWGEAKNLTNSSSVIPTEAKRNGGILYNQSLDEKDSSTPYQSLGMTELEVGNDKESEFSVVQRTVQRSSAIYSKIPPLRLIQKVSKGINFLFDASIVSPLAKTIEKGQYTLWKLRGRKIFHPLHVIMRNSSSSLRGGTTKQSSWRLPRFARNDNARVSNIKKEIYAPLSISTKYFPWHKKAWFHLKHTRPNWYKRYHQYPVVHYFHFAILIVFMSALGFASYRAFFEAPKKDLVLAAPVAPPRILSFQGRLTDNADNPITTSKAIRFAIYNNITASGAALLWQEVNNVSPDTDGIFSVLLGNNTNIAQSLFAQNASLYLGVTIGIDSELTPRQQLATVSYATNAEVLQGMPPTTDVGQTTNTNTILALNSSGTLVIGGSATTTFQATSAKFKITGQPLLLTTNGASNGNVAIAPDGTGIIDLQKPLQNTSNSNNVLSAVGSVEVDDLFSILATSSGQSAFTINQTGSGPIISASASGIAKFTIDNSGNSYIAGNLGIGNANPTTTLDVNGNLKISGYATSTASLTIGYSTVLGGVGNGVFSGNIGVGTTNPSQRLEVANGNLKMTSGNIILNNNWLSGDGGNEGVFVKSDGNVGIGTTDPGSKLQIAGDITPEANGTRNLGSASLYWSNLYVNNIIGASTGIQGFWQRNSQILSPTNITDDLLMGLTATPSAATSNYFQIFGTGSNAGDASSSGILTLGTNRTSPTIQTQKGLQLVLGSSSTGPIQLSPAGTTGFYVNTAGNVGIGTTVPLTALDVVGSASLSANMSLRGVGTVHTFNILDGGALAFGISPGGDTGITAATPSLYIQKDGNVGIGTTNPGTLLHVSSSGSPIIKLEGTGFGSSPYLDIKGKTAPGIIVEMTLQAAQTGAIVLDAVSNHPIQFSILGDAKVTFNTAGNVGIGITAPVGLLNVNGTVAGKALVNLNYTGSDQDIFTASSSGTTRFRVQNTGELVFGDNGSTYFGTLDLATLTANRTYTFPDAPGTVCISGQACATSGILGYFQRNNGALSPTNITDDLLLGATSTTSALVKLTGTSGNNSWINTGNVGIGTTVPLTALDVTGSASLSANMSMRGAGTIHTFNILDGGAFALGTSPGGDGGVTAASPALYIQKDGNVGIGTSGPNAKLEVNGRIMMDTWTADGDTLVYKDDPTGNLGVQASDIRLKKNLEPLGSVLDTISNLPAYKYNMLDEADGNKKKIGIMAQDLLPFLPEATFSFTGSDGQTYYGVHYEKLSVLALEGIREQQSQIEDLREKLLTRVGTFTELVVVNIKTGALNAADISTNSLSIATANVTIAGESLRDYIARIVSETLLASQDQTLRGYGGIISPIAKIDQINTNIISPLSSDQVLVNGKLVIKSPDEIATGSANPRNDTALEVHGNASISGNLNASEASIAGTLRAKKIVADEIEGLEQKLTTLSAASVTNITNIYNIATPSAAPTPSPVIPAPSVIASGSEAILAGTEIASSSATLPQGDLLLRSGARNDELAMNISSYSGQLSYVENFTAEFGKFNQGMISLGPASFESISVVNQLSIGANFILADGSINVLGGDLELQPLKQGGISMMANLFHIDTDGNVKVGGDAQFEKNVNIKGVLSANIIAPIPDSDLVIKLGGSPSQPEVTPGRWPEDSFKVARGNNSKLVIQNASGSSVMTIDNEGNLIASGTANIKDLFAKTFNVVRGAQADTSFTETVATASAGTATIITGEVERTIISPHVTENSLIYITPTSDTQGITPYVARQTPSSQSSSGQAGQAAKMGSFTIQIPERVYRDIKVNWWIVN